MQGNECGVLRDQEPGVVTVQEFDWYQGNYDTEDNSDLNSCAAFMLADEERVGATFVHANSSQSDAGTCYAFRSGFQCTGGNAADDKTSFIHCGRADTTCALCAEHDPDGAEPEAEVEAEVGAAASTDPSAEPGLEHDPDGAERETEVGAAPSTEPAPEPGLEHGPDGAAPAAEVERAESELMLPDDEPVQFSANEIGAVHAQITLLIDVATLTSSTQAWTSFQLQFQQDVGTVLGGIDPDRVQIKRIRAGSTVVDFVVLPASDGTVVASSSIVDAFSTGGIAIAGAVTTAPVENVIVVTIAEIIRTGSGMPGAYQGCFTDDARVNARDMQHGWWEVESPSTALEECARMCSGFSYMGLQWSSACFCDNSYGAQGVATGCGVQGENCGSGITDLDSNPCSWMNAVFAVINEGSELELSPSTEPENEYCAVQDLTLDYTIGFAISYPSSHADFGPQQVRINGDFYQRQMIISEPLRACENITVNMTGKIALIQRGDCYFRTKVWNAEHRGAVAVVIYNADGRSLVNSMAYPNNDPSSLDGIVISIPSIFIRQSDGDDLYEELASNPNILVSFSCDNGHPLELTEYDEDRPCNVECQTEWDMVGGQGPVFLGHRDLGFAAEAMCATSYHVNCSGCQFCTCHPDCMSEWADTVGIAERAEWAEQMCEDGFPWDCHLCPFCLDMIRSDSGRYTPRAAHWTVHSGPCEVFGPDGSCVGRPNGYNPNERCEITAHGGGKVSSCPVWNIDWTIEMPCFSAGLFIDQVIGSAFTTEGCGTGECPVGHVLGDGDPVVWQSDGGIQGNIDPRDPGLIRGTSPAAVEGAGLGGGWALCLDVPKGDSEVSNSFEAAHIGTAVVVVVLVVLLLLALQCRRSARKRHASEAAGELEGVASISIAPGRGDIATQLQELVEMHQSGYLTDAEFEAAKRRTLRMDQLNIGLPDSLYAAPPQQVIGDHPLLGETLVPVTHGTVMSPDLETQQQQQGMETVTRNAPAPLTGLQQLDPQSPSDDVKLEMVASGSEIHSPQLVPELVQELDFQPVLEPEPELEPESSRAATARKVSI